MKTLFRNMTSRLVALLAALALALAQSGAQAQPAYSFSQQELDQMVAPIALYPDALLSQILMAATYPDEVVEAARWAGARPGLSGDEAVRAAETENWDPSVKSLVAFPQVLAHMGANPQWTQALGDAFLDRQSQVMDTVQALRRKAQAAGNLRSDDRLRVLESGPSLLVQPFDPQVVYVPYYDPLVVYGSWWWPAYPPVYLRPWPGYYARPAYAGGFYWGPPIGISAGFFFGAIDWRQRQVRVVQVNNYYYNQHTMVRQAHLSPQVSVNRPGAWHHDPDRRRGLTYRGVDAQQRIGAASAPPDHGNQAGTADARRSDRGTHAHPDARFEARRADARPAMETRANVNPAPAAQPAPATQTAPVHARFDHRRETRGPAQSAQPAPAMQPVPVIPVVKPVPVMQSGPVAQPAPATQRAPASRGDRQAARQEPALMSTALHEPAARHQMPQASPPRADTRSSAVAAREDSRTKAIGRPRMVQ